MDVGTSYFPGSRSIGFFLFFFNETHVSDTSDFWFPPKAQRLTSEHVWPRDPSHLHGNICSNFIGVTFISKGGARSGKRRMTDGKRRRRIIRWRKFVVLQKVFFWTKRTVSLLWNNNADGNVGMYKPGAKLLIGITFEWVGWQIDKDLWAIAEA